MRFGILGTGMVGATIGSRLIELGHEVCMGSRSAHNEKAIAWAAQEGAQASQGSFADAAAFGKIVFNCTLGAGSVAALRAANSDIGALTGKIVIDVSNPLDFSRGMPPTLFVSNDDSLAEQLQRAVPAARIVKALNTMSCDLMVRPALLSEPHDTFICGDDPEAKADVASLLRTFGWERTVDLGPLSASRGVESFLPLWIRLWGALGSSTFNIKLVRS